MPAENLKVDAPTLDPVVELAAKTSSAEYAYCLINETEDQIRDKQNDMIQNTEIQQDQTGED